MPAKDFIDITDQNFEEEVLVYSSNIPVVLLFWAKWSKPSAIYKSELETLFLLSQINLRLGFVDLDSNPLISSQLLIHTLPTLRTFFQGQPVGDLIGSQPQFRVINYLKSIHFPDPIQLEVEKGISLYNAGDLEDAKNVFFSILEKRSDVPAAQFYYAKILLFQGNAIEALYYLKDFPASKFYSSAEKLLPLASELSAMEEGKIVPASDNDYLYLSSLRFASKGKYYNAIDGLLDILRTNKSFRNNMAKRTVLSLLEMLSDDDPTKRNYQAELASILF